MSVWYLTNKAYQVEYLTYKGDGTEKRACISALGEYQYQ